MPTHDSLVALGRLAANHMWQSTGFAAVAVLLALVLKANHARVRYWLWMAASVKFLIPFSVLAAVGSFLGRWLVPATPVARLPLVMGQIAQPFAPIPDGVFGVAPSAPASGFAHLLPGLLLAIWFCGVAAVLVYGWTRWRRVAAVVRASAPLREGREAEALKRVAVRQAASLRRVGNPPERRLPTGAQLTKLPHLDLVSSAARLEPGIFGIFRPVLWLPSGIGDHLGDAELEAILAHELCHARRRDNLAAAIHMAVEAIFWFHPLVWWLGARLIEERERACDEEVVRLGGEPQVYAESILKVCEFYLASPVPCAAGVTGGELKKRIEGIMTDRFASKLSYGKRMLLASAAILVTVGPIVLGAVDPSSGRSQSKAGGAAPVFQVASVKPNSSGDPGTQWNPKHGNFTAENASLKRLIGWAYHVSDPLISGPGWLDSMHYDINAKGAGDAPESQVMLMLQALLEDRFHLRVHRETREMAVYLLVVANGGLKMQSADEPNPTPFPKMPPGPHHQAMQRTRASLAEIADGLSGFVRRPVLDRTGIPGAFRLRLWFNNNVSYADNSEPEGPDLFAALREQLGLRLEAGRAPVEMLVVDQADKVPTEN